jgi:hypothetical protein
MQAIKYKNNKNKNKIKMENKSILTKIKIWETAWFQNWSMKAKANTNSEPRRKNQT